MVLVNDETKAPIPSVMSLRITGWKSRTGYSGKTVINPAVSEIGLDFHPY